MANDAERAIVALLNDPAFDPFSVTIDLPDTQSAPLTADAILAELEEARQMAIDCRLPSQAVQASMGKAKIAGLIIDKKEVGGPGEFATLSDADLEAEIKATEAKIRKFRVVK